MDEGSAKVVRGLLEQTSKSASEINESLRGMFGLQYQVDEMAFLITYQEAWHSFLAVVAQTPGYELFNMAEDTVQTQPIASAYKVRYWFFRTPYNYRLEIMQILAGVSPLHEPLVLDAGHRVDGHLRNVHASFKCASEDDYMTACGTLYRNDWEVAQRCASTYGKFSYFVHSDAADWYLKPRINLRDARDDA